MQKGMTAAELAAKKAPGLPKPEGGKYGGFYNAADVDEALRLAGSLDDMKSVSQLKTLINECRQAYPKFVGIVMKAWAMGTDPKAALVLHINNTLARKAKKEAE